MADSPTATLEARIAAAMAEITTVQKRGQNKFAGYDYATADDVYDALRPILARHGLTVWQRVVGLREIDHKGASFLVLEVATGLDGEDPDKIPPVPVPLNTTTTKGVRLDAQAIQAGLTYAQKYYLRSRFLIATGDPDADADAPQVVDASKEPKAPARKQKAAAEAAPIKIEINGPEVDWTIVQLGEFSDTVLTAEMVSDPDTWTKAHARAFYTTLHKHAKRKGDDVPDVLEVNADVIVRGIPYQGRITLATLWKQVKGVSPRLLEKLVAETPSQ